MIVSADTTQSAKCSGYTDAAYGVTYTVPLVLTLVGVPSYYLSTFTISVLAYKNKLKNNLKVHYFNNTLIF
jgi:hypothetical protein